MPITLRPEHLTSEAFKSFGDVIELPIVRIFQSPRVSESGITIWRKWMSVIRTAPH
jgi:ureidoglycolate hydrolase